VDTGVTNTAMPLRLVEELKLEKICDMDVTTASGVAKEWLAYAEVEMLGDRTIDRVVVLDGLKHVLIGVLTLEALGLKIGSATGRVESIRPLASASDCVIRPWAKVVELYPQRLGPLSHVVGQLIQLLAA